MDIKITMYIRWRRKAYGVSLKELSRRTGISAPTLSRIERGKRIPHLDAMLKIAIALDTEMETLFEVESLPFR